MNTEQQYYAHGKLLITGEYSVLDGATAFAIPCRSGQSLTVTKDHSIDGIIWTSWDVNQKNWLKVSFDKQLNIGNSNDTRLSEKLQSILKSATQIQPDFLEKLENCKVDTHLEFDRNWGLGSSSTLISLISQWAQINPYKLLDQTFGGSGYDIACATTNSPILFQIDDRKHLTTSIDFNPSWIKHAHFVYLGQKQVSSKEVKKYSQLDFDKNKLASEISDITQQLVICTDLFQAQKLLQLHESKLSVALGYPSVKSLYFSQINGTFKSLGAWGGDFVLFLGDSSEIEKIKALGFPIIIPWKEMIFNPID